MAGLTLLAEKLVREQTAPSKDRSHRFRMGFGSNNQVAPAMQLEVG